MNTSIFTFINVQTLNIFSFILHLPKLPFLPKKSFLGVLLSFFCRLSVVII